MLSRHLRLLCLLLFFVLTNILLPGCLSADDGVNECVTLAATTENNCDIRLVATLQCDFSNPDPEVGFDYLTISYGDSFYNPSYFYLIQTCNVHALGSTCELLIRNGTWHGTYEFWSNYYDWYGGPVVINFDECKPSTCTDGIQNQSETGIDCGGPCSPCTTCVDNDHDGHFAISPTCPTGDDPNDNDASLYPGAPEICGDGKDNNGNGLVDEGCYGDNSCLGVKN